MKKVLIVYGTRPECLKLYPVVEALKEYKNIRTILVNTQQQKQLSDSFTKQFKLKPKYELNVMVAQQSLNHIISEITKQLDDILVKEKPDLLVCQGDVSSSFAAALTAFNRKIPIAHLEAGLRTYNNYDPFPEEKNRQLITQLADYHFCPTEDNMANLLNEIQWDNYGALDKVKAWITGNTSIDVVKTIKPVIIKRDYKQILLTLHRRENIESGKAFQYLSVLEEFLHRTGSIKCKWVVHPNSNLKEDFTILNCFEFVDPLPYNEFVQEMYNSDLILSDSGAVSEECTIIKTPLFILRNTTERPEVLDLPFVKLVKDPLKLSGELEKFFKVEQPNYSKNKYDIFGKGNSGLIVAKIIATKILK